MLSWIRGIPAACTSHTHSLHHLSLALLFLPTLRRRFGKRDLQLRCTKHLKHQTLPTSVSARGVFPSVCSQRGAWPGTLQFLIRRGSKTCQITFETSGTRFCCACCCIPQNSMEDIPLCKEPSMSLLNEYKRHNKWHAQLHV